MMKKTTHQDRILNHSPAKRKCFSAAAMIIYKVVLRLIVETASPRPDDCVLDVACGSGLVVCAFAPHVRLATGIDLTPAMLEQTRKTAGQPGLRNVARDRGDELPIGDGSFSIVITRYGFHHLLDPLSALREWRGLARPAPASSLSMLMRPKARRRRPNTTASNGCAILPMPEP
jgi:ubiquinone/menaquinone biosynthesis C-methylase UbiE